MTNYIKIYFNNGSELVEKTKEVIWGETSIKFTNDRDINIWINLNEVTEIRTWIKKEV